MPELPAKKGLGGKSKDEASLTERKAAFNKLLNAIVQGKAGFEHLAEFLQPRNILSNYKKVVKNTFEVFSEI